MELLLRTRGIRIGRWRNAIHDTLNFIGGEQGVPGICGPGGIKAQFGRPEEGPGLAGGSR